MASISWMVAQKIKMVNKGHGTICIENSYGVAELTHLSFAYPLRLMPVKRNQEQAFHRAVFMVGFGGGMLDNDSISINISVAKDCSLSLLTQASTKIYKSNNGNGCRQELIATVQENGLLALLPEPLTCFKDARYEQRQEIHLEKNASLIVLDWVTSGRSSRGESWLFTRYASETILFLDNNLLLREPWQLQNEGDSFPLHVRMHPYHCFATILLFGPRLIPTINRLKNLSNDEKITRNNPKQSIIWSGSIFTSSDISLGEVGEGMVLRAAAQDTVMMRSWILYQLSDMMKPEELDNYFSRI